MGGPHEGPPLRRRSSPRGGPWDDEVGAPQEGPPREVSRRTVVVLRPTTPPRAEGPPGGPPSRPSGSVPVLTPRQGPPPSDGGPLQQQQGAPGGGLTPSDSAGEGPQGAPSDRRRLPLMALSDIIRQQHTKGKVSYVVLADWGLRRGPLGGPPACASPAASLGEGSGGPLILVGPQ
ncbi:hypothetical protein Emed_006017 [Eimeria media]